MSKTTELVERLRELPRDTRKATVEIYDLCIEASYEIEELTDRCARYAEEIAVLQGKQKWVDAGAAAVRAVSNRRKHRDGRMQPAGTVGTGHGKAPRVYAYRRLRPRSGAGRGEMERIGRKEGGR